MIKKWRNLSIIFGLVTIFLFIVGYYLFIDIINFNRQMDKLKREDNVVWAELRMLPSVTYNDEDKFIWGYVLPSNVFPSGYDREGTFDGVTTARYSKAEYEQMGHKLEVYYVFMDDGTLFTKDKLYADNFKAWFPTQGVAFWVFAFITLAITVFYIVRNIVASHVLKNGNTVIATFEGTRQSFLGTARYTKIIYSYEGDEGKVTVTSPAIYESKIANTLSGYGTMVVKYIGKRSFIDTSK